jgi:alanyl-tRNA synthetase
VADTQRPRSGLIVHYGQMIEGHLRVGTEIRAEADLARRQMIMRNHSATICSTAPSRRCWATR